MKNDLKEIIFTADEINAKVRELAKKISKDYENLDFVLITILKGSFIFASDLVRNMDISTNINFMEASSYGNGTTTSGELKIKHDLDIDIRGKHVLIVEDIIDSGITLSKLKNILYERGAGTIKICSLLNKPSRRQIEIEIDYLGFNIPDEFVVGYGMDYAEKYRNLPYVGILKPEIYTF